MLNRLSKPFYQACANRSVASIRTIHQLRRSFTSEIKPPTSQSSAKPITTAKPVTQVEQAATAEVKAAPTSPAEKLAPIVTKETNPLDLAKASTSSSQTAAAATGTSGKDAAQQRSPTLEKFFMFTDFLIAGFFGAMAVKAYQYITYFPPICQEMLNKAEQSPFIVEHVGIPFRRDLFWWGTVTDDSARVSIGITGPHGEATIEGKAYRLEDNAWEVMVLHGAIEKFGNRLTDLLPTPDLANVMPYIPHPHDPSAAHNLAGAPSLPFTPSARHASALGGEPLLLPDHIPHDDGQHTSFQQQQQLDDVLLAQSPSTPSLSADVTEQLTQLEHQNEQVKH